MPPETPLLAGSPTLTSQSPGRVVHAACRHHAEDVAHALLAQRAPARQRVHAAVREGGRRSSPGPCSRPHRALAEVEVERRLGRPRDDVEVAQQVGDRAVAMAGLALRAVDALVDLQRPPGVVGVGREHALERVRRDRREQPGAGDGPGVDHRVERRAGALAQADLVERLAARLDADAGAHRLGPQPLQRDAVGQRLGDRLDRERHARVAGLVDAAVDRHEAHAQIRGIRQASSGM